MQQQFSASEIRLTVLN